MCSVFIKRLVENLKWDKKEKLVSVVMNHVRTRLRFAILRSTVIAIRGARGKIWPNYASLNDVSLNILPEFLKPSHMKCHRLNLDSSEFI